MPKALCISGMVIAVLVFILFSSDFVLQLVNDQIAPFKGAAPMMDIVFILCSVALAFLSWKTFREQV